MYYVIDNSLLYIIDAGTLKLKNDSSDESYKLTPILNRLLVYIIENRGRVIQKDEFLREVWEKYGIEGSVNTLTQYLSNLRRILRDFIPEKECIVTYPRQGYTFSSEIMVEEFRNNEKDIEHCSEKIITSKHPILKIVLSIILLTLVTSIGLYFNFNRYTISELTPSFLYQHENCNIYTLVKLDSNIIRETNIRYAEKIIEKHNIKCSSNSSFYLSVNRGAEHGISGNVMLAHCTDDNPKACVSYQYSRW